MAADNRTTAVIAVAWAWRNAPALLAGAATAILGAALFFQHAMGLQPCELCILQRWGVLASGVAALAALAGRRWAAARSAMLVTAGMALLATAGIAGFHVGVEQHWWAMPASCVGAAGGGASSLDALRAAVLVAKPVECDVVQWSFLGVSMAGWNIPLSLGLAAFALGAAARPR